MEGKAVNWITVCVLSIHYGTEQLFIVADRARFLKNFFKFLFKNSLILREYLWFSF